MEAIESVKVKQTRASVLRDSVVIRLAVDEAGPKIRDLLKENGFDIAGINWSNVNPNWLIATVGMDIIGCVQVLPALPVGRIELLFVKPSVSFKLRAIAIRKLTSQAMMTLDLYGCDYAACGVDVANEKFANVLENLGCVKVRQMDLFVKRLSHG